MKRLTEDIIKEEALLLFIERGYEGTSLANIGDEVGIKKQSIYTHFKNKDDLFLKIMNEVIHKEIEGLYHFFEHYKEEMLFEVLYQFIMRYRERFLYENDNIKFLLRMMFIPPTHLQNEVIGNVYNYYNELEKFIDRLFYEQQQLLKVDYSKAKDAFLNLIDGLLVELIYVSVESFDKRLNASWEIFKNGVLNDI